MRCLIVGTGPSKKDIIEPNLDPVFGDTGLLRSIEDDGKNFISVDTTKSSKLISRITVADL